MVIFSCDYSRSVSFSWSFGPNCDRKTPVYIPGCHSAQEAENDTIGVKLNVIKRTEENANVMVGLSDYRPDNA
jgi:hypothetical protein